MANDPAPSNGRAPVWRDAAWVTAITGLIVAIAALLGHFTFHIGPDTGSGPTASPSVTSTNSSTTAPTPTPTKVVVQNVYNIPLSRATPILNRQGFLSISIDNVCSNSVSGGNVREVILDNGARSIPDEIVLVDENGTTSVQVAPGTPLTIKVSNGKQC